MHLFQKLPVIAFFLLILSSHIRCANIQQPTGGPRDSIPPTLLNELPPNLSTQFKAEKIVLSFDEFIKLNNANREVSISPDMDHFPTFNVRRRNLEIELPDSLEENTTYVINFGEAIADNNEGNAFKDYRYVFSTGEEIDSLNISGRVINARTNEPEQQISVILIPISQDSIFGKKKANIFATTDSSGNFQLRYLREDRYQIYALNEKNNDRIYNNPDESIGFLSDTIHLQKDTTGLLLWTSKQRPAQFRILDRQIDRSGRTFFKFNRPLEYPRIQITDPAELDASKIVEISERKDSVNLWLADLTFDSLKVAVFDRDSLMDSIMIRRPRNDQYDRNLQINTNLDRNKVNKITHLQLTANAPLQQIDRSKIVLLEDSIRRDNFHLFRDSIDSKKFIIRYNWKPKINYDLRIEEDALNGYFDEKNLVSKWQFTLDETEKFGDILLTVNVPDTSISYLVELVDDKKENVFRSDIVHEPTSLSYKNFPEGRYMVRIIYDTNQNGKWDPGDLAENTQPERVWYFEKTFIIRPNWEQEEKVEIPSLKNPAQILRPNTK